MFDSSKTIKLIKARNRELSDLLFEFQHKCYKLYGTANCKEAKALEEEHRAERALLIMEADASAREALIADPDGGVIDYIIWRNGMIDEYNAEHPHDQRDYLF